jgi:hypothetical protein
MGQGWVGPKGIEVYLQFYVHLGPESPLDERWIMEDRFSSGTSSMPQTWTGRPCS